MKVRKIFIVLLFLAVILTTKTNAVGPEITATSGVVIDCIDGKILYSKNMEEKLYPASLTNILTAILVVENCNMQDAVVISQSAISNVQPGYLTSKMKAGETFTVQQLLNLLLISSYSDVSNALAEHIAGSTEKFTEMMNNKAKEIGCTNSNFVNSNGEHDTNHYSTAKDMALIAKYAMQFDEIKSIAQKTECSLPATEIYTSSDRNYYTTNEMLKSSSSNYYKYAKGIKAAFTTPAGNCLITYSIKNDIPLVAVVMKSTTQNSRYTDAKSILEYSYDNNVLRTIAKSGTNLQTLNVKKGTQETKKLNAILENNIIAVVKKENENANVEPKISINDNLKAPIEKGTVIGKVSYEIEGKTYTANLIAESNVEKSHKGLVFLLIFLSLLLLLGGLRIRAVYKRKKVLKKIRKK